MKYFNTKHSIPNIENRKPNTEHRTQLRIIHYLLFIIHLLLFTIHYSPLTAQPSLSPANTLYQRDVIGAGMGGTGVGDMFRSNASFVNPALSVNMMRTTFSTALSLGNITYKDENGGSFKDDEVYLPYVNVVFPHKQSRFGFHYNTISAGNFNVIGNPKAPDGFGEITERRTNEYALYRAGIFWANRNVNLHFALGLNYVFGHNKTFARQTFSGGESLPSSTFENYQNFRSPMFNLGVAKNFGKISAGAVVAYPLEMKGNDKFRNNNVIIEKDIVYDLPPLVSVGMAYRPWSLFHFAADVDYERWSETDNFADPIDTYRLAVGAAWAGFPLSKKFLAIFPVRAGVSIKNMPYKYDNKTIYETGYHFGLSIPLKGYDSYIDLAAQFYNRDAVDSRGVSENGMLFTIGTTGFDFFRGRINRKVPREIPLPDGARRHGGTRQGGTGERPREESSD